MFFPVTSSAVPCKDIMDRTGPQTGVSWCWATTEVAVNFASAMQKHGNRPRALQESAFVRDDAQKDPTVQVASGDQALR